MSSNARQWETYYSSTVVGGNRNCVATPDATVMMFIFSTRAHEYARFRIHSYLVVYIISFSVHKVDVEGDPCYWK